VTRRRANPHAISGYDPPVRTATRARSLPLVAEATLAFVVGLATFVAVGGLLELLDAAILAVAIGVACVAGVVLVARRWGVVFAAPAAFGGLVAFDWFQFPPTHPFAVPDAGDLAWLAGYVGVAVFVGELAAHAGRRAMVTEQARSELAEEQAALRRVATRVARREPPSAIFAAVAREVGTLLGMDGAIVVRYADGGAAIEGVEGWSATGDGPLQIPRRPIEDTSLARRILDTGRAARIDDYGRWREPVPALVSELSIRSSVAAPIVVDGGMWGAIVTWSQQPRPLPADVESRLTDFTELVATAVSDAAGRAELAMLADEQAALRRVAVLVAREAPPAEVFAAVAEEVGHLLEVDVTRMYRYDPDDTATAVADWGETKQAIPVGATVPLDGDSVVAAVRRTGRPARIDDHSRLGSTIGRLSREMGTHSAVGAPIVVNGSLWGAIVAATRRPQVLPANTEERMSEFTELVGTAISNIQARTELAESRARIAAAADEERRRVVRDLHDGAQQRLVHTVITLKMARQALERGADGAGLVEEALGHAEQANAEVRELAHGIMPAALSRGGLCAGVDALAERMPLPVDVDVDVPRLPSVLEATAYFVVAEALTNVVKHAGASRASVSARVADGALALEVRDDGDGGAREDGSGLLGLADRVAIFEGRLRVVSPPGDGTVVSATIPLPGDVQHLASDGSMPGATRPVTASESG